jgi:hypothetical protein
MSIRTAEFFRAPHGVAPFLTGDTLMLAISIYIVETVRRMLRKLGRSALIVADAFQEAQKLRRALPRVTMDE